MRKGEGKRETEIRMENEKRKGEQDDREERKTEMKENVLPYSERSKITLTKIIHI